MLKRYRLLFIALGGITFVAAVMAVGLCFQPRDLGQTEAPGTETQSKADDEPARYYRSVTCHQDCQVHFGAEHSTKPEESEEDSGNGQSERQRAKETRERLDLLAQRRMAYWSIWIAGFTLSGLIVLIWTLWENLKVGRSVERQLIADHPPRIKVAHLIANFLPDHKIEIDGIFFNVGAASAFLFHPEPRADIAVFVRDKPPPIQEWRTFRETPPKGAQFEFADPNGMVHREIVGGADKRFRHVVTAYNFDEGAMNEVLAGRTNLFVIGFIRYADPNGNLHWSWFCRKYAPSEKTFEEANHPEYEFQT